VILTSGYWFVKADSTGTNMATSPMADNLTTSMCFGLDMAT
jgi:hypothetical protein